jgi:putative ABC transport system permease protein
MSNEVIRAHTTTGLNDYLLVSADAGAQAEVEQEIAALGLVPQDRDTLVAAGSSERDSQPWVSIIVVIVLLGYVALSVVNTLVMATAERRREFALLRLIGMTNRQVRKMTRVESILIVIIAVIIAVIVGTAISIPPLVGIAIGVSGQPIPSISIATYLGIVVATVVLGIVSIAVPTHTALRKSRGL